MTGSSSSFSMPAPPPGLDPQAQVQMLQKQLEQQRQQSAQQLHEVTSAAKQSVNEQFLQAQAEAAKRAQLEKSAAAAAASTDDIRRQRGTLAWNQALAAELKAAREETRAALREASAMKQEKQAFFEQQMENEVAKASSAKKDRERFLRKMDEEAKRSKNSRP